MKHIEIISTRVVFAAICSIFISILPDCANAQSILTGPIVNPGNGYSYYLLASSDWIYAESQALSMGGNLVTVADAADNQWILDTFADYGGVQRFLWIGLYDPAGVASDDGPGGPGSQHAADFVWVDGQPYNFSNWSPGEPNDLNDDEYYVEMFPPNTARGPGYPPVLAGTWNDVPDSAYPYEGNSSGNNFGPVYGVVEVVPEPSAYGLLAGGVTALLVRRRQVRAPSIS